MAQCHITFILQESFIIPKQREYDEYLMKIALTSHIFAHRQLCSINYCRTFLGVTLLSDIALPCGRRIDPGFVAGTRGTCCDWRTCPNVLAELLSRREPRFLERAGCSSGFQAFEAAGPMHGSSSVFPSFLVRKN